MFVKKFNTTTHLWKCCIKYIIDFRCNLNEKININSS
jgi:hypothetical protein